MRPSQSANCCTNPLFGRMLVLHFRTYFQAFCKQRWAFSWCDIINCYPLSYILILLLFIIGILKFWCYLECAKKDTNWRKKKEYHKPSPLWTRLPLSKAGMNEWGMLWWQCCTGLCPRWRKPALLPLGCGRLQEQTKEKARETNRMRPWVCFWSQLIMGMCTGGELVLAGPFATMDPGTNLDGAVLFVATGLVDMEAQGASMTTENLKPRSRIPAQKGVPPYSIPSQDHLNW